MPSYRNPWFSLSIKAFWLGMEAQGVIALRVAKAARGGKAAEDEARLMVSEKAQTALDANVLFARSLMRGEAHLAPARAVALYRRKVNANRRRLSKRA